jgi:replicative DNA helicase
VSEYLEKQRYQSEASKVALIALDVAQGRKDWADVVEAISSANELEEIQEELPFVTDDLEELYNENVVNQGLRWRLDTLNKILGSLRKGKFGFVFARPEVGKTTFLASEVTFMAGQTDRPILWVNNEEQGSTVNLRCYQAALGLTHEELFQDIEANRERFYALTHRNIKIYDDASVNKKAVEKLCQQLNPALIIFDQIDKIYGFEAERHDLKLKTIYQWARELAKMYGPVIGICQAGGTGEGKKYLSMTDVDSSHTAKQAEADWILGIGASNNEGDEFVRYLSVCKNKLEGDNDTIEALRHGKVSVLIEPIRARYKDSMKWN